MRGVGPACGASRKAAVDGTPIRCETDVLECPRCAGRMSVVAAITQPEVIRAMLECIGLPARPPPLAPARPLVQPELDFGAE